MSGLGMERLTTGYTEPKYDGNLNFELGPRTDDARTWSLIDRWFNSCVESHSDCRRPNTANTYMPTRVLEVDHSKSTPTFRLVKGSECPPHSRYVTLSHCWGSSPDRHGLRLLESTISGLGNDASVDNLPKTFIDALNIAGRFGIRYVWIDRLCIYQDSAEDWRRESSLMHEVYKKAYFSVSALGADDDNGGCFFPREPSKVAPSIVRLQLDADGDSRPFRFELEKGWAWRLSFEKEPLVNRAWVVQERLLAPRIIHFGRAQVFWECGEAKCCETHPDGVRFFDSLGKEEEKSERRGNTHLWKQLLDAPDRRYVEDPYEQLFLDWNAIVTLYAKCKLTVASDKLVALSGLAKDMKRRLQELRPGTCRYLAGLWEEKLLDHVTWNVVSPAQRASKYRAPSWSWACLDGRLNMRLGSWGGGFFCASLISAQMQLRGEDETAEVTSGSVTLTGPFTRVQVEFPRRELERLNEGRISSFHEAHGSDKNDDRDTSTSERFSRWRVIFDTLDDVQSEVSFFVVEASPWHKEWSISGLALTPVNDNTYRRVGLISCDGIASIDKARRFWDRFPRKEIRII